LDVGSGTGSNLPFYLKIQKNLKITCLEPDKKLFLNLKKKHKNKNKIIIKNIKLSQLIKKKKYNTIIYADVLEHIRYDFKELRLALNHLKKNGRLIILCPAHNFLFTSFDKNVGHFRRYNKKMFQNFKIKNAKIEKLYYLDSLGYFLSLLNKFFLKRNPKKKEIKFWDNIIVPLSIISDILLFNLFGKSIVCVYKKVIR
jgi:SAM-dependent methyltransferase